jgi:hypothetical protein
MVKEASRYSLINQKSSHIVINLLLLVWGIKCIEILESYGRMSRPDVARPIGYGLGPAPLPRPLPSLTPISRAEGHAAVRVA